MAPKCKHTIRCSLKQTEDGYKREDICTTCNTIVPCQHFKLPRQTVRYGRDRFKPQAIVDDFDLTELDFDV